MDRLRRVPEPCGPGRSGPDVKPAVIIVSDVLLYREGLAASLSRDGKLSVLRTVTSADAMAAVSQERADVLLVDGGSDTCLALAANVRTVAPELKIVGFGIAGGADRIIDCAAAGLIAFVDSDGDVDQLVKAIFAALRGELLCSPRVSALMCERLADVTRTTTRSDSLTRREREIAALIAHGLSNKEIANDLHIGASTVKNHVHSILEKLQVRRRSAIFRHVR